MTNISKRLLGYVDERLMQLRDDLDLQRDDSTTQSSLTNLRPQFGEHCTAGLHERNCQCSVQADFVEH
jgi:hypothetical protein